MCCGSVFEVPEAVDSYLKSEDATDYLEVIQAWHGHYVQRTPVEVTFPLNQSEQQTVCFEQTGWLTVSSRLAAGQVINFRNISWLEVYQIAMTRHIFVWSSQRWTWLQALGTASDLS